MGRTAALVAAMLFAMPLAALIMMLTILRGGGWKRRDQADNRGRNQKFAHQSRPQIPNA